MIPHPCPALVAAPSAPCPRSFAREALVRTAAVLALFGRNWTGHVRNSRGTVLIRLLFAPGLRFVPGVLCIVLQVQSSVAQAVSVDKISPQILAHQKAKQRPVGIPHSKHAALLVAQGLNTNNLAGEDCALYTSNQLSQPEIEQLATNGIAVIPGLWIPPVAGKHPFGYYLATVNYQRLDVIRADAHFVRLESTEFQNKPMNDLGEIMINVDDVHNGNGVTARNGSGVKLAVADSGVDLTHADIPTPIEAYDMTTGTSPSTWSTEVPIPLRLMELMWLALLWGVAICQAANTKGQLRARACASTRLVAAPMGVLRIRT